MCAINGITGQERALVERMNAATKHRGPDGTAVGQEEGVTLGFNRLAIIDLLPRAMQPMEDASGRYALVFNGEIYNYRKLKRELSSYPYKTESDTEVILAAYSAWGQAAFAKLNGMFSLALYDRIARSLTLARDPSGIKPLYYHFENGRLAFSSEMKGMLAAGIPARLNREAFFHYLRLLYVPHPLSPIQGISKLPPGHLLTWQDGALSLRSYLTEEKRSAPRSYADALAVVRAELESAVTRQLVSDRPVGLYLSGGIDSSILLALATKTHPAINTYSIGFDLTEGEEREKFNADAKLARATAKHFGASHHEFLLSPPQAAELFRPSVRALDEPVGNSTILAQFFLSRQVKPTATVVLTGDGGDELFGGYERYRLALLAQALGRISFAPERLRATGLKRFTQLMFTKDTELARIFPHDRTLPDTASMFETEFLTRGDIARELMGADERHWLVDEALTRTDRLSMAHSVEARVPFLDNEVRALAHALPSAYKVTPFATKKILRRAFANILPREVLRAPKRGWFSPGAKWLRRPEFEALASDLFATPGVLGELIDMQGVEALWWLHREKKEYHFTLLWALMVFLAWGREYRVEP